MVLSVLRSHKAGVLLAASLAISLAAAQPAIADDTPPPPAAAAAASPDVHTSIDDALAHQRSRRGWAVAGIIAGSSVILGASVYAATRNTTICVIQTGCRGDRHSNTGYYIAAGVGLPLLGYSIYLFSDAQHNINQLNTSRVGLGYSPDSHQPMLQASIGF